MATDSAVFDVIAKELLEGLNETVGNGQEHNPSVRSKIAVRPFPEDQIPVSGNSAKRYTELLSSALLRYGSKKFEFVTRSALRDVIDEITKMGELENWNSNPVPSLLSKAKVDILITGRINRRGLNALISYRAIRMDDGKIMAASRSHRAALGQMDRGPARAALSMTQAVLVASQHFKEFASDMSELALGGLHFEDTGVQTRLGRYLEEKVSNEISILFLDVLSNRKLIVRRAEFGSEQMKSKRDGPVDRRSLRPENFDDRPGRYTLTGNYWDFQQAIELRLKLRNAAGEIVPWQNSFRTNSVPQRFAIRPPDNFAKLRENDGLGPITFDLTSGRGKDPGYKFGENLSLLIRTGQDAWLYCFYLDASANLFKIFPNFGHENALLKGKILHSLPGKLYPFDFIIGKPAGLELVKCFAMGRNIATELPPELRKLEFEPLPRGTERRLSEIFRGIPNVSVTEASLVVTVIN